MASKWKIGKNAVAAQVATNRLTKMQANLDDSQAHWVAFVVELPLPMGLGFDKELNVSEIQPGGHAELDGTVEVGDSLTHFDGVDLRNSGKTIVDVLDRTRDVHTLVLQRLMVHSRQREGCTTMVVRLVPINGSMGIGLDASHCISAIYRDGAADRDGRLQVGDALLAMDGVDLTEGVSLIDVIDPQRSPHQLIVARRNELIEYAKMEGAATELIQFTVMMPMLTDDEGQRRMGLGLSSQNVITEIDPGHAADAAGELQVGDFLAEINGFDVYGGAQHVGEVLGEVLDRSLDVHELLIARLVPLREVTDRPPSSALSLQRKRIEMGLEDYPPEVQEAAATAIQAAYRGKDGRELAAVRAHVKAGEAFDAAFNMASQMVSRGSAVDDKAAEAAVAAAASSAAKAAAATTVQAAYRGRSGRMEAAALASASNSAPAAQTRAARKPSASALAAATRNSAAPALAPAPATTPVASGEQNELQRAMERRASRKSQVAQASAPAPAAEKIMDNVANALDGAVQGVKEWFTPRAEQVKPNKRATQPAASRAQPVAEKPVATRQSAPPRARAPPPSANAPAPSAVGSAVRGGYAPSQGTAPSTAQPSKTASATTGQARSAAPSAAARAAADGGRAEAAAAQQSAAAAKAAYASGQLSRAEAVAAAAAAAAQSGASAEAVAAAAAAAAQSFDSASAAPAQQPVTPAPKKDPSRQRGSWGDIYDLPEPEPDVAEAPSSSGGGEGFFGGMLSKAKGFFSSPAKPPTPSPAKPPRVSASPARAGAPAPAASRPSASRLAPAPAPAPTPAPTPSPTSIPPVRSLGAARPFQYGGEARPHKFEISPSLANTPRVVGIGNRSPDARGFRGVATNGAGLGQRYPFAYMPAPTPAPLPSERGTARRKKLKEEIEPIEKVEQETGVQVVHTTPRGQTPMKEGAIKARLAFFLQFEEEVDLEC